MRDLINNVTEKDLLPALRRTVGTYNGSGVNLKGKGGKVLVLLSAGNFGTNATLDVKIQESDDGSTWTDLYTFAQRTSPGFVTVQVVPAKRHIRAQGVVGTAAVDFGVQGVVFLEREIPSGI